MIFGLLLALTSYGKEHPRANSPTTPNTTNSGLNTASLRNDCVSAGAQTDQAINNVRARLLAGGDVWWDGQTNGRYIVPKVEPGEEEVSSIFAGAVWLGGLDQGNNLKVACQTYGSSSGQTDFWPGPLTGAGTTEAETCETWDRFFTVTGTDVRKHRANFLASQKDGVPYNPSDIPESIRKWPAVGNEYFEDLEGFRLPDDNNGLAGFWDYGDNGVPDGRYDPEKGDFPIVEIRGCDGFPVTFPDEMIFWIYNDNGNIHSESNGDAIRMEVQVQAFAFQSDDEINDMTFQRYKLINRATENITETYFAMWVDGDLGCFNDDFIGSDTTRSLAYYYNADARDGDANGGCGGVPTYDKIPAIGIDYFRGPVNENFEELGMSSFTYYNNNGVGGPWQQGTTDPQTATEYYNYLSGLWRDGTPFTRGGSGYDPGNPDVVDYAFIDLPDLAGGWSMCEEGSPQGDRRTIQASGPFTLSPGAKNELIIGAVWIEELIYPCPNINALLQIDDVAQSLFDNCFEITRGPSAPDLDFIELNNELICVISNDEGNADNNNIHENYAERDLRAPGDPEDSTYFYQFEGYQIYQLAKATSSDLTDPDQARLIREMDVKNGVDKLFNWEPTPNPLDPTNSVWAPVEKSAATDEGIDHTFSITEDQFAPGDRTLINHKTYYFTAIAYGYNQWEPFRIENGTALGQREPYISGDLNIRTYTPVPRPINDLNLNSFYGDGVIVSRLEGKGNGGNFIELTDESFAKAFDGSDDPLEYKPGQAPIQVKIINPIEVKDGTYEFVYTDNSPSDSEIALNAKWTLTNLDTGDKYEAEEEYEKAYEQIIEDAGISIRTGLVEQVGAKESVSNGAIGAEVEYINPEVNEWLTGFTGQTQFADFMTPNNNDDPDDAFTSQTMEPNVFFPFVLAGLPTQTNISPQIDDATVYQLFNTSTDLTSLNNVDIVMTKDKSKWSRCIVLETTPRSVSGANAAGLATEGNAQHFNTRRAPSVSKDADSNGNPEVTSSAPGPEGYGWFPGYAIDVETGERLNIFFGEASGYDCSSFEMVGQGDACALFENGENSTGRDMMWNPTQQQLLPANFINNNIASFLAGGHHWVYVTNTKYDECESHFAGFNTSNPIARANELKKVTWAGAIITQSEMLSYNDGLIPEDLTYRLRVSTPLEVDKPSALENDGYPRYRFKIEGKQAQPLDGQDQFDDQLANMNIVPNPYYAFSNYESQPTSTIVKLTNLPNQCSINIFSIEGKFIRSYNRNVAPNASPEVARGGVVAKQTEASLEWDLKNSKGIPVASGTYLINVVAPGIGERTMKLFMIQRQFDPTGL